ncbi:MAG TPA: acyl-CoA dehydrogenase family protein [Myxococcota bacterium]|nr:acyl-CoA dehydrogenase family protein [Myxococcota bacterium]
MNFGFSEEQELLRSTAREFLAREAPMTAVRELMDDPRGYRPETWAKLAELGWLGLLLPEEYGGAGLSLVDEIVVAEELGRALTPSPFLATFQGALAVLHAGTETQKKELLPDVAAGRKILTFAITEEAGNENPDELTTRAERKGAGYALTGTKLFVPDAQNADVLVVAARSGGPGEAGIALFLVEKGAPGLAITPLASMDQTRRIAEVRFEETPAQVLGSPESGWATWKTVRAHTLVHLSAEALGGAQKVLEDSVKYAKERVQFGKPIGVNQAIKHKCADMLIQVESSKSITYYAAWAVAEKTAEAELAASMAKAYTSDAYRATSAENIQIHGGVGFTWEYDCHLYFKRAKAIEVTYGDSTEHRERVAQLLKL